jgi:5-(carboxyamino)imidazole ribonucleotide synthase
VIVCRNLHEIKRIPVEMEFHQKPNQVEYVICPARIDSEAARKARRAIVFECFEKFNMLSFSRRNVPTEEDENCKEVAPRPHIIWSLFYWKLVTLAI